MRVLFGIQQREPSPGSRYRVTQFLPRLEAAGISCDVLAAQGVRSTGASVRSVSLSPPARAAHLAWAWVESQWFLLQLVRRVRRYDRCYLYRIPISGWAARLLAAHRDRLVYDFDDAIDVQDGTGALLERIRQRVWHRGLQRAIRCCHVIVTSNERNAEVVSSMGGRAVVVPTSVDVERYAAAAAQTDTAAESAAAAAEVEAAGPAPRGGADAQTRTQTGTRSDTAPRRLVLGWIGTPSTSAYLPLLEEPLLAVAQAHDIEIRLIGAGRNPFARLPASVRAWSLATETQEIAAFDIGLMPMPDTPWTRGKAALKALQYGAAGIPTIASWTTTNEQILGTDEGTLYCRTADDWRAAVERLLRDAALRHDLGTRARRRVDAHYSVSANLPKLIAVLRA
jgi:glycosyltransferase involved in cell wall biosynthesis